MLFMLGVSDVIVNSTGTHGNKLYLLVNHITLPSNRGKNMPHALPRKHSSGSRRRKVGPQCSATSCCIVCEDMQLVEPLSDPL